MSVVSFGPNGWNSAPVHDWNISPTCLRHEATPPLPYNSAAKPLLTKKKVVTRLLIVFSLLPAKLFFFLLFVSSRGKQRHLWLFNPYRLTPWMSCGKSCWICQLREKTICVKSNMCFSALLRRSSWEVFHRPCSQEHIASSDLKSCPHSDRFLSTRNLLVHWDHWLEPKRVPMKNTQR